MSNALDQKEAEFALKVRRALDESISTLPAAPLDKLAAARFPVRQANAAAFRGWRLRGRCWRLRSDWRVLLIGKISNARLNSPISTPPC